MSTRYNTGNPIESTDVRDMSDNAKNFDEFSNSMSDSFTDRFGRNRQTIEGSIRKAVFQPTSFDFVTGGTLVSGDRNKAVFNPSPSGDNNWYSWQGAFPKIISPNSTPSTSGGLGDNAWKPVTNNILAPTVRESIRRSYAEVGYNLVDGSFEAGGTLTSASDVLLQESSGKAFGWGGTFPKTVAANAPTAGFVDKSLMSENGESQRNFRSFGAIGDGVTDDSQSLQSAFDWAGNGIGRTIVGTSGDRYAISTGIVLRFDNREVDQNSRVVIDFNGSAVVPNASGITCVKLSRDYSRIRNLNVIGSDDFSDVTALAIAPEDETQTTRRVSQQYCTVDALSVSKCATGLRFMPGPTVAGRTSGAYYHTVYNPRFHQTSRGFHFARSLSGDNLNTRIAIYNPIQFFGNVMFDMEAVDSLIVNGGSCEFLKDVGVHADAPTIKIHKPVPTDALGTSTCAFYGFYGEAGTTPYIYESNTEYISYHDCVFFGYDKDPIEGAAAISDFTSGSFIENGLSIGSRYNTTKQPILSLARYKGANAGKAFMRYLDRQDFPCELWSDRGFTFSSSIDIARIRDLRNTYGTNQIIGTNEVNVEIAGTDGVFRLYNNSAGSNKRAEFGGVVSVGPDSDNGASAGYPAKRYSVVYSGTGAINTSDAREKTTPLDITDAVLDAWQDVSLVAFKWLKSIEEKGGLARIHFGLIAQQVRDAFIAHGLDGTEYGLLCHDEWGEVVDEKGIDISAGDRWGIRHDQCLFLEAALQRRNYQRLLARLEALENK